MKRLELSGDSSISPKVLSLGKIIHPKIWEKLSCMLGVFMTGIMSTPATWVSTKLIMGSLTVSAPPTLAQSSPKFWHRLAPKRLFSDEKQTPFWHHLCYHSHQVRPSPRSCEKIIYRHTGPKDCRKGFLYAELWLG